MALFMVLYVMCVAIRRVADDIAYIEIGRERARFSKMVHHESERVDRDSIVRWELCMDALLL